MSESLALRDLPNKVEAFCASANYASQQQETSVNFAVHDLHISRLAGLRIGSCIELQRSFSQPLHPTPPHSLHWHNATSASLQPHLWYRRVASPQQLESTARENFWQASGQQARGKQRRTLQPIRMCSSQSRNQCLAPAETLALGSARMLWDTLVLGTPAGFSGILWASTGVDHSRHFVEIFGVSGVLNTKVAHKGRGVPTGVPNLRVSPEAPEHSQEYPWSAQPKYPQCPWIWSAQIHNVFRESLEWPTSEYSQRPWSAQVQRIPGMHNSEDSPLILRGWALQGLSGDTLELATPGLCADTLGAPVTLCILWCWELVGHSPGISGKLSLWAYSAGLGTPGRYFGVRHSALQRLFGDTLGLGTPRTWNYVSFWQPCLATFSSQLCVHAVETFPDLSASDVFSCAPCASRCATC